METNSQHNIVKYLISAQEYDRLKNIELQFIELQKHHNNLLLTSKGTLALKVHLNAALLLIYIFNQCLI